MDCDGKSESSPEREAVDDETKGLEGAEGVKKRKRRPYRPGMAPRSACGPVRPWLLPGQYVSMCRGHRL